MATPTPPGKQDDNRSGERGSYRSGFFFGTLSFLGTAVLGFVSTIVTARLYGVETIGEFTLAIAPAGILFVLSTVKEQQALIREIAELPPKHPRVTQLFAAVFTFSWGLTAVVASLDVVACWFLFRGPLDQPDLFAPAAVSVLGYVLVTNTGWNIDTIFSAFVAGRQLFWVRLCEAGAFIALAVGLGLESKSVWSLVAATIGASLAALLLRVAMMRRFVHTRISWGEYRVGLGDLPGLLPFGLRATPGQMAQGISQQAGVWALGLVGSNSMVGAYSRAISIPQRLQQASLRVTEVLYPTLVGRHSQGDGHGFDRALVDSIRYEVIGMLLLAATIGGAANSVLQIFGPGFDQATTALALLAVYPALASITVGQTQALWAVDRPGTTSVISIARMTLTIGLLIVLTPSLGITGPAVALLAGYAAGVVLCGIALRPFLSQRLRATWPIRERLAVLVAYGAGFLAAHEVEHLVPTTFGTLLALVAGAAVYVPVFATCGGLNKRDRDRLRQLAHRVRPRPSPAAQSNPA
ncbi:MAG TPA: polysaccharide biosynthesis C-terminal domain-containing protein [Solirubrobacterales bacterium]|nr:polysaccharide biosynthesis C-terminal domain-containing protein [Solirubrobacterales bacterium]